MKVVYLGDDWDKFNKTFEVVEETERTYVCWTDHTVVLPKVDCEILPDDV